MAFLSSVAALTPSEILSHMERCRKSECADMYADDACVVEDGTEICGKAAVDAANGATAAYDAVYTASGHVVESSGDDVVVYLDFESGGSHTCCARHTAQPCVSVPMMHNRKG